MFRSCTVFIMVLGMQASHTYVETATACWRKIDGAGKATSLVTASACQQLCSNSEICVGVSYSIEGDWAGTCFLAASNDNPSLQIPCASSSIWTAYTKQVDSTYSNFTEPSTPDASQDLNFTGYLSSPACEVLTAVFDPAQSKVEEGNFRKKCLELRGRAWRGQVSGSLRVQKLSTDGQRAVFDVDLVKSGNVPSSEGLLACWSRPCLSISRREQNKQLWSYVIDYLQLSKVNDEKPLPPPTDFKASVALVVRTYAGALSTLFPLLRSIEIFWPYERWPVVLVLDAESIADQIMSTVILPRWVHVAFEEPPPKFDEWKGFQRDGSRDKGYMRVNWAQFYLDQYTDAEFVAQMDSDTVLHTWVDEEFLFDSEGRPRVTGWTHRKTSEAALWAFGLPQDIDFMAGQPMLLRRKHFEATRHWIIDKMQATDFDDAIRKATYAVMSNSTPNEASWHGYVICHQSVMGAYIWERHRSEYAWHIMWHQNPMEVQRTRRLWNSGVPYPTAPAVWERCPQLYVGSHLSCWGVGADCRFQKDIEGEDGKSDSGQGGQKYLLRSMEVLLAALCSARDVLLKFDALLPDVKALADRLVALGGAVSAMPVKTANNFHLSFSGRAPDELCENVMLKYSDAQKLLFGILNHAFWVDEGLAAWCLKISDLYYQWQHHTLRHALRFLESRL